MHLESQIDREIAFLAHTLRFFLNFSIKEHKQKEDNKVNEDGDDDDDHDDEEEEGNHSDCIKIST